MISWLWLALLVSLLTAAPAHAFYNPQTGHWLNRDPIGESGFQQLGNAVKSPKNPLKTRHVEDLLHLLQVASPELVQTITSQLSTLNVVSNSDIEQNGVNLYFFVGNNPVSEYDRLGLIKVCIRLLTGFHCTTLIVHCYLDLGDGTTFSYDRNGIHADPDPNDSKKTCVDVSPSSITAAIVEFTAKIDQDSGNWNGAYGQCCIWVDHVLTEWGSSGLESYFPGYKLP